jgi:hypothetical protein
MGPNAFNHSAPNKLRVHKKYKEPEKNTIPINKTIVSPINVFMSVMF